MLVLERPQLQLVECTLNAACTMDDVEAELVTARLQCLPPVSAVHDARMVIIQTGCGGCQPVILIASQAPQEAHRTCIQSRSC
jgi:hypothetical protein